MIELIKKYWYIITIAGIIIGFIIGRSSVNDKTVVRYENGKTVSDTIYSEKLVPYRVISQVNPELPMKHDTIRVDSIIHDVLVVDTAKIISNYIEKKMYKNTLFDNETDGKLVVSSDVQYNSLVKLGYEFTPMHKVTTITRKPLLTPWIEVGYNSFGYYSAGGGLYFRNLGFGLKGETDLVRKGFSVSVHYKL